MILKFGVDTFDTNDYKYIIIWDYIISSDDIH